MRLGCGCALVALGLGAVLAGGLWAGVKVLQEPEIATHRSRAAGNQQPVATSGRNRVTLTMSEADVAALTMRQLKSRAELPVRDIVARIPDSSGADIGGRMTVEDVGAAWGIPRGAFAALPGAWREHPVWLTLRATPHLTRSDQGRPTYLRVDVNRLAFGRLPVPAAASRWIGLGLLRWELSDGVEEIRLEPGRVTVRIVSSRPRSGVAVGR